jgi:hypothetical protein
MLHLDCEGWSNASTLFVQAYKTKYERGKTLVCITRAEVSGDQGLQYSTVSFPAGRDTISAVIFSTDRP